MPTEAVSFCRATALATVLMGVVAALGSAGPAVGAAPSSARPNPSKANTGKTARQDAEQSIPLNLLAPADRAKVESVLSNFSVFRRMPVKVIDCDPNLYLFLVRHPDVVINIWETLKISQLQLHQTGDNQFQMIEPVGTKSSFKFVYQNHDTHVIYGEGTYQGPLLARMVRGQAVLVLKTGYVRETNGRYYIASRLDCFLNIQPAGAELLTKAVSPLLGKTVDNNFVQTAAFLGSLSRTAELSYHKVAHLATRLSGVQPEVRDQFVKVASQIAARAAAAKAGSDHARLAVRRENKTER